MPDHKLMQSQILLKTRQLIKEKQPCKKVKSLVLRTLKCCHLSHQRISQVVETGLKTSQPFRQSTNRERVKVLSRRWLTMQRISNKCEEICSLSKSKWTSLTLQLEQGDTCETLPRWWPRTVTRYQRPRAPPIWALNLLLKCQPLNNQDDRKVLSGRTTQT